MKMQTYSLGRGLMKVKRRAVRIEVEMGSLWISGRNGTDYILNEGDERSFNEKGLVIEGLTPLNFFRLIPEKRFNINRKDTKEPKGIRSSSVSEHDNISVREDLEPWKSQTESPWEGPVPTASQSSQAPYNE
jgi:hypothetical protein